MSVGSRAATSSQAPLLEVSGLNAWYGNAHILFDVGFTVDAGQVVALAGPNGSGKSTVLKAIVGLLSRTRGSVRFEGDEVLGKPAHKIARLGIGYVPEERRIFTDLTVLENLETGRQPSRAGMPAWTPQTLFKLFPNLAEMPNRRAQFMSGGEQQMLSVARTLMGNPRLVLLDEPSEGVAPVIVDQMIDMVIELKRQGLSVLLSEQNQYVIDSVADQIIQLRQGHVV